MTDYVPYRIIAVTGPDRVGFLQGQLTQDVGRLRPGTALPAAWCNPQGRVLTTGTLFGYADAVAFAVPSDVADMVLDRLRRYRLRAAVELAPAGGDWDIAAAAGTAVAGPGVAVAPHAGGTPWYELAGPRAAVAAMLAAAGGPLPAVEWRRNRIAAGLADIGRATSERYTPHMLNLDRVGALSFTKGCYTGQEIVARTEHLGRVKRRLAHFEVSGHAAEVGDALRDESGEIGEVVCAAAADILAMLPVDRAGGTLRIGAGRAEPRPLPWDGA